MNAYRTVVVARTIEKAIELADALGLEYRALFTSPTAVRHAGAGRGIVGAERIVVDAEVWPLDEQVRAALAPLITTSGGHFYRVERDPE
ncbi:hypothetical protein P3F83_18190 [Mycobacteroides immunogenum]|uniref:hypothetical protein n=1 Tax=Mycobacteroides immunogenum TaxID=83262 RepID=UPI0025B795ED|nr:hypothetical protein [Mycobacteroides immunogenum]WJR32441.1 hypothetical protein P3F83_18190 [Mycobacteroides immunogenum]